MTTEKVSLFMPTQPFIPTVTRSSQVKQYAPTQQSTQTTAPSFGQVLSESVAKQEQVRFSAHAQSRARMRNINLDQDQLDRLGSGVDLVAQKGGREALVMVDDVAAVVNVNNKTVITVADATSLRDNVFTGIDSAVIV